MMGPELSRRSGKAFCTLAGAWMPAATKEDIIAAGNRAGTGKILPDRFKKIITGIEAAPDDIGV